MSMFIAGLLAVVYSLALRALFVIIFPRLPVAAQPSGGQRVGVAAVLPGQTACLGLPDGPPGAAVRPASPCGVGGRGPGCKHFSAAGLPLGGLQRLHVEGYERAWAELAAQPALNGRGVGVGLGQGRAPVHAQVHLHGH